jgi:uncharacterized protein (TIGR02421 family)
MSERGTVAEAVEDRVPAAVREVDRELARLRGRLDLLLELGPLNAAEQWERWRVDRHEPRFRYRPTSVDLDALASAASAVQVGRIAHPGLRAAYERARDAFGLELRLVAQRCTDRFLATSIELHGPCEDDLHELALELLERIRPGRAAPDSVTPARYAAIARREVAHYRRVLADFDGVVRVRDDVSGPMVVGREHLVGADSWIPAHRAEPLAHHEVGVHLYTAVTGGAQPLRLLEQGTAGHAETQEGLGVAAELVSGGLDEDRLRVLAGRVVAVRAVEAGDGFGAVVDRLVRHAFPEREAWSVAMRVLRAGGYTKDVIYLRGLVALMAHLRRGPIDPLLVGRLHVRDVPLVRELLDTGVLTGPAAPPRWLELPGARDRLDEAAHAPPHRWCTPAPRRSGSR